MKKSLFLAATLCAINPFNVFSQDQPEGWARCTSIYSADDYDLTGGGTSGTLIVLRSNGSDMRQTILEAINNYDIVVFDGKDGDFMLSKSIYFRNLKGRTLVGVNGACLRTKYIVPDTVHHIMDSLNVKSYKYDPDDIGGTLSNGTYVKETGELHVRQAMIDFYGDQSESYRHSGIFAFYNCSNMIVRNLDFVGPGALDLGGDDAMTLYTCDHVWVDHCCFTDGLDGNLDIVQHSDFVTVSDTHFRYSENSYNHPLSNLTGGPEPIADGPQKTNISWMRCWWGPGCSGRMPYANQGYHHILNCYWDGNTGACIDGHNLAKILVENSHFTKSNSKIAVLSDGNETFEWRGSNSSGKTVIESNGKVEMPYKYTVANVQTVPTRIVKNAGPILENPFSRPLTAVPAAVDFGNVYADVNLDGKINISSFGNDTPSSIKITAPDGVLLSTTADGTYSSTLEIKAEDDYLLQSDVYIKTSYKLGGVNEQIISVTADSQSLEIPIKANVTAISENAFAASLIWPLDKGTESSLNAATDCGEVFSEATFSCGDKIYVRSTQKVNGTTSFTSFNPTEAIGSAVDADCCISFDVEVANGYTFIPTQLKLDASRVATDMCYIDIEVARDNGESQRLLTQFQPERTDKSPSYSEISLPLNNVATGNRLHVKIYLYYISANKQLALRNVEIAGRAYATEPASVEIPNTDRSDSSPEYHDLQGRHVTNPQPGTPYIVTQGSSKPQVIIKK